MCLQKFLMEKFESWMPPAPEVINRTKDSITMRWDQLEPFSFLADDLLFCIEKNNKIPKWIVVYSGGKTIKVIDNLAPRHPHRFRLKIVLKANAVPYLADKALAFYKDNTAIYDIFNKLGDITKVSKIIAIDVNPKQEMVLSVSKDSDATHEYRDKTLNQKEIIIINNTPKPCNNAIVNKGSTDGDGISNNEDKHKWIQSLWSEETWTNTDTDGTSAICFSMAVRCGYLKQVQAMLEERQDLISVINSSTGFTALATAVRKGNINMVRFLVSFGADVNETSSSGQTPLHLAVLSGNISVTEFLLENGANFLDCDKNGLRIEHYAVDSCSLDMLKFVIDRGGDIAVKDNNDWTPLFRAVCQEAKTEIIEELIKRGSDVDVKDRAGVALISVAKLLKSRCGRRRDSVMRLVDSNYPHEKAFANFSRLSKKVHNVHSLLKLI